MSYHETASLEQLRCWLQQLIDARAPAADVRPLLARIRAAEMSSEPGLYQLGAMAQIESEAAQRGPQSTAWQALLLLDERRAQAAWRRYWGADCRPDGSVVVA